MLRITVNIIRHYAKVKMLISYYVIRIVKFSLNCSYSSVMLLSFIDNELSHFRFPWAPL